MFSIVIENMNYINKSLILAIFTIILFSCQEQTPFKGDLHKFSCVDDEVMVKADSVNLEHPHGSFFAVHDSLAIMFVVVQSNYMYEIYNTNDGSLIGQFFPRGNGHGEFMAVSGVNQLVPRNVGLTAMVNAIDGQKLIAWNITKSVEQNTTVYEESVLKKPENHPAPFFSYNMLVGKDSVMGYLPGTPMLNAPSAAPVWYLFEKSTNRCLAEIHNYDPIDNPDAQKVVSDCFSTSACAKPDGTKLVESMYYLPQINIIDVKSGKVSGYLMKGHDDYSIFSTDMRELHCCYRQVTSTDKYIFALWSGRKLNEDDYSRGYDEVHVFDWDGRMLKKVKLSVPVQSIYLDQANDLLYGCHQDRQPLYRYKVADMGL